MLTRRVNTQRRTLLWLHRAPAPSPLQEQEVNSLHRPRFLTRRFEEEHVRLSRDVRSTLCLMLTRRLNTERRRLLATLSARTLPVAGAGGQHFASASIFDSTVRRGRGARAARRTRTRFKHAPDSNARPIQTRARFKHRPDCVVYDNKSYKTVLPPRRLPRCRSPAATLRARTTSAYRRRGQWPGSPCDALMASLSAGSRGCQRTQMRP